MLLLLRFSLYYSVMPGNPDTTVEDTEALCYKNVFEFIAGACYIPVHISARHGEGGIL